MKRRSALSLSPVSTLSMTPLALLASFALVTALGASGCSKEETPPVVAKPATPAAPPAAAPGAKPKGPTPVNEAELPKIPIEPGYKYYIGGPFMAPDKYGKQRIKKFNDEVAQPPSRGMVFGVKQEGDKMEYKVWGNGRPLALHRGTMRDGLYWSDYLEAYKQGKMVARENLTHNDEIKRSKIITEEFDYETGELIRTKEMNLSYYPAAMPDEMKDEDDEDAATGGEAPKDAATPPAAAPATPPAAAPAAPATPPAAPAAPAH